MPTLRNEDIAGVLVEVPEGHTHVRTTITLRDGTEFTLQEATVAGILRAFATVKTHPQQTRVRLAAVRLPEAGRKAGYAEWQLMETDADTLTPREDGQ